VLEEYAMRQLCSRYQIPFQFFQRLPVSFRNLCLNHFIQNVPKSRSYLRIIRDNRIRGILSEKYAPFDDHQLFEVVSDVFGSKEIEVQWSALTPTTTYCRILFPKVIGEDEIKVGDVVRLGLNISNSEVGARAVRIEALIYRLVCQNGLIAGKRDSTVYLRHIGHPDRIRSHVKGMIEDASTKSRNLLDRFKQSVRIAVDKPEEIIEKLITRENFNKEDGKLIFSNYLKEAENNMFAMVNSITHTAQLYSESAPDKRYAMERAASTLLQ